jgi:transcriptional regulator with XRE-family HTH domain
MKVFQLKVSRAILNLSVRDIGGYIGVSGTAVSTWESKDINLNVNTSEKNIRMLEQFFAIKNIFFSNESSVSLNESNEEFKNDNSQILTRFQLRGGRAILGINRKDLASLAQIDQYVITRAERLDNKECIRPKDSCVPVEIKRIFIQHGISFPSPFTISIKNS